MQQNTKDNVYKNLIVTFSDNSRYSIPVSRIAELYQIYYPNDVGVLSDDILDFAQNSVDWCEVESFATKIPTELKEIDKNKEWCNADMEFAQ